MYVSIMYVCVYVCIYVCMNLPSPSGVAQIYMCLGLTDWDWITYQGLIPKEN